MHVSTADRVRTAMAARGMSQRNLAEALDCKHQAHLSKLLAGHSDIATARGRCSLANIATALGVTEAALRTGVPCVVCGAAADA